MLTSPVSILHDSTGAPINSSNPLSVSITAPIVTQVSGTVTTTVTNFPTTQFVSGTVNIGNQALDASNRIIVVGASTSGSTASGNPVVIAGVDINSIVRVIKTDSTGKLLSQQSTSSNVTSVSANASNVTLLATNANRQGATIYNDSTSALYLKLGATASTTSFTLQMSPRGYYEVPFGYVGQIDGIWSVAVGTARITEIT